MTHIEELIGKGKTQITMDRVPVERAAPYAAADAALTYRLVAVMRAELEKTDRILKLFEEVEMPLIPVLADMDMNGVRLDLPYLKELAAEFTERLNAIQTEIFELASMPFNIGSPNQ